MTSEARTRPARRALRRLARLHGVQTSYVGTDGLRHEAPADTLVGVLRALDVPVGSPHEADVALEESEERRRRQIVEPVVVARSGAPWSITLSLDKTYDSDALWVSVRGEDGSVERRHLGSMARRRGRVVTEAEAVRSSFELADLVLPLGYHRIEIEGPGVEASALLISAPDRCPRPARGWGVFAPVHAVRVASDQGVGSLTDMARLARWLANRGGSFVGTLPVLATFRDEPWGDPSPYRPASKVRWDEALVGLEALPEFRGSTEAQATLRGAGATRAVDVVPQTSFVDPTAIARKRSVLALLADSLCAEPSTRRDAFDAFVKSQPELQAYARFRATGERVGQPWPTWSASSSSDRQLDADGRRSERAHLYAQWLCAQQLDDAARWGAGMYLDVPVGVHPFGFDTWRWPQLFAQAASGGAPPDDFAPSGQDWGFPPLHPERIREDGYRYVIDSWRHCFAPASVVRIDHIAGLHRLYWVPAGADATQGAYVRYRAEELYAVLVLEAHRAGTVVVGEDLGTVPSAVRRAMAGDGILSSWVMQFSSRAEDPAPRVPRRTLASLGTHDLPTFDGYFRGRDIDERRTSGTLDADAARAAHDERARWRRSVVGRARRAQSDDGADRALEPEALAAVLAHLAVSPADLVLVDMEDLWLEPEPQNRPGTRDAANFTRRWRRTLEDVVGDAEIAALLGMVDRLRRGGDR